MAKPIPVTYKNKTYKSIAELSRNTNVPASLIKDRLKKGMTIETAVDVPKRIIHRKKHYVFDHLGKKYKSIEEMCLAHNQKKATYERRMRIMGWTKEQALTIPPQKTVSITCKNINGTTYKSINELCRIHNISRSVYYHAIKNNKPINQILKNSQHNIMYKNKTYKSVADLCKSLNLNSKLITERIRNGMTLEEAVKTPVRLRSPKNFKIIKTAYSHDDTNYYECIHNNQKYILSIPEMKVLSKKEKEND